MYLRQWKLQSALLLISCLIDPIPAPPISLIVFNPLLYFIQVHQSSYDDSQIFLDAWEFQENDIMNAQDKLRSLRAKIVVLESKMAMELMYERIFYWFKNWIETCLSLTTYLTSLCSDAQKNLEVKQKQIDNARRALRLIRSTCIVWPNSASQVLLVGSFDGWATQVLSPLELISWLDKVFYYINLYLLMFLFVNIHIYLFVYLTECICSRHILHIWESKFFAYVILTIIGSGI